LEPETLLSLVDAAIAIVTGFADGVVNSTDILIDKAPEIIGDLVYSLIRAIPMLQEASDETIDKLTEYLTSPETAIKLVGAALEIIIRFAQGIIDNKKKSFEAAKSVFNEFKNGILSFIDSPFEWGKDLIDNFIGGIKSKMNSLKDTVMNVAQSIKDLIGFSEPKEGPLSNFHTYAPDMIDLFIKGVRDNEGRLRDQIATSFDFGEQTITAGHRTESYGRTTGGNPISGTSDDGSKEYTINLLLDGRTVASMLFDPLKGVARQKGVTDFA
jgi:phage-related protein